MTASSSYSGYYSFGLITTVAFLAWFAIMAIGRMPRGLRDLSVYCLNYGIQYWAYLLIVTDRYPDSDPLTKSYGPDPAPDHPIRISEDAELRRSRLTVFFRFLLFLPHYVCAGLGHRRALHRARQWFVTLFAGQTADALHRFNGAYVRYTTQVYSVPVSGDQRVSGLLGAPGSYPVDLRIAPPERQNRWKTGFRLILAFPALIVTSGVGGLLLVVGIFGWFVGLFLGRMPVGLRFFGIRPRNSPTNQPKMPTTSSRPPTPLVTMSAGNARMRRNPVFQRFWRSGGAMWRSTG